MEAEPQYGYSMTIETAWVLARLPPQFGVVFNLGSEEMFEWMADGLSKYRREVLGWQ
jgi:hypothetical protein